MADQSPATERGIPSVEQMLQHVLDRRGYVVINSTDILSPGERLKGVIMVGKYGSIDGGVCVVVSATDEVDAKAQVAVALEVDPTAELDFSPFRRYYYRVIAE